MEVGESKVGLGLQDVNKIMCSLERDVKGVFTERQTNGQGSLKAKVSILLKKLYAWGVITHHDLPS